MIYAAMVPASAGSFGNPVMARLAGREQERRGFGSIGQYGRRTRIGFGDVPRDFTGAPILTSILQNPQDGLIDTSRQSEFIAILRSAISEATRIVNIAISRASENLATLNAATANSGRAALTDLMQYAIPRLGLYGQQVDAMESDAASPFWTNAKSGVSASYQGKTFPVTPFEALLGRINQEIVFSDKTIADLAAADQQPGFWSDLWARAGAMTLTTYNAIANTLTNAANAAGKVIDGAVNVISAAGTGLTITSYIVPIAVVGAIGLAAYWFFTKGKGGRALSAAKSFAG